MVYIHRMIGWLCELMQNPHTSATLRSGAEHRQTELLAVHRLRARESEEDATRGYLLECARIEPAVTLKGIAKSTAMLGKCRRVEDY